MPDLTNDLRALITTATHALERGEVVRLYDVEVSVADAYVRAERIARDGTRSLIALWQGPNAHAYVLRRALFAAAAGGTRKADRRCADIGGAT